jgi:predicted Zn finger-like uncharacterized protein
MKVECDQCKKVYTFKQEKLPPYGFTFRCKVCDDRIQVSQAQLDEARSAADADKKTKAKAARKLPRISLPKFKTDKLKKPFVGVGGVMAKLLGRPEGDKMTFVAKTAVYLSMGLLFVVVLLGVFTWLSIGSGKAVTFAEVQRSLELKRDPLMGIQAAVPDIQLPGLIQEYVGDDYREEFVGWMNGLQKHQQEDFINNLETVISQARSLDPQHVEDFIVEYQKLKSHRTAIGPFAGYLLKFSLMVVLLVVVCLLVLLSLVLFEARGKKSASPAKAGAARRPRPKGKPSLVKSTSAK